MKKISLMLVATGLLATSLFTSCKKEEVINKDKEFTKPVNSTLRTAPSSLFNHVSVSSYGFLVLADSIDYAEYIDFLDSNNSTDIGAFHTAIGFTSQATVQGQANNYVSPSTDNSEYLFSQSGIVQVGNIVVRSVNDDGYFLAMPVSNLNQTSYNKLVNRQFDPQTMCKLWIGDSYGNDLNAFVTGNIGLDNTNDPPPPPTPLGKKVVTTSCSDGICIMCTQTYFLGILIKTVIVVSYP